MKYLTKALLACSLLVYATSVFYPWSTRCMVGGARITYWSFKARIYPYPYPDFPPPYEEMFFDYWSWCVYWAIIFVSQMSTLLFGLFTLLKKPERRYAPVFIGLTLLFSAVSIGTFILHSCELSRMVFMINIEIGFWIASFAFPLLIASLLTLIKAENFVDKNFKKRRLLGDNHNDGNRKHVKYFDVVDYKLKKG